MASGPITSWQINGEKMETVIDLIFWDSKITADSDSSHKIKRRLLLGRKAMTNLESLLKSRDITLLTKVCILKATVFPVIMYNRCENWTIKKAEHWKVDAFELWYWRRLLRVPWTARRWCWERLMVGGDGDDRGWYGWMASLTQWTWVWVNSGSWWWTGRPGMLQSMGSQRVGHSWATELNWPLYYNWDQTLSPLCLLAFCISSFLICHFMFFVHFSIRLVIFFLTDFWELPV